MLPCELLVAWNLSLSNLIERLLGVHSILHGKLPVEAVWSQWKSGNNTNIYQIQGDKTEIASRQYQIHQEGCNSVLNSASFVQFCDLSGSLGIIRVISHPLRWKFLDSILKVRVSINSVLKGLFPLGNFSNKYYVVFASMWDASLYQVTYIQIKKA